MSYLLRAHVDQRQVIEAGVLDTVKKAVKKGLLALVGIGLFSGLAHGKDFNKSQLEKASKQFNAQSQADGLDLVMKASMQGEQEGSKQLIINYKSSDGSSSSIIYMQGANGMTWLDLKQAKGSDGIVDPVVDQAAKLMFKQMRKYFNDEGIELNVHK